MGALTAGTDDITAATLGTADLVAVTLGDTDLWVAKKTVTYASFPTVPTGTVNVACTVGAGVVAATSGALREGNSTGGNGTYISLAVLPDDMGLDDFSTTVTNAGLDSSSDRGAGGGNASADGTVAVFAVLSGTGKGVAGQIYTWVGGMLTGQASQSSVTWVKNNTIELRPAVDADDVVTWTLYKNGVATALTWTDEDHLVDLPGSHPALGFRHQYSSGQYSGPGISALVAQDL